jgi:hypothetical protein
MKSSDSSKVLRKGRGQGALLLAAAVATLATTVSAPAHAVGVDDASATAKGTVGGALIGAEAVTFTMAAFDVHPTWWYLVGAGAGAAAGGVGGHFLESSLDARGSMILLAAGMLLAVPTTVFVLNAAAYSPPADYVQDTTPIQREVKTAPASSPEMSRFERPTSARHLALRQPRVPQIPSLVGMDEGVWTLGIPAVAVLDVYSPEMRRTYNLERASEVRVPVLAMRF